MLNARYLEWRLRELVPSAVASPCMHEFVVTTKGTRVPGLRAVDVAKRLIDHGVYAPTTYFPTTVPEALMFEPTETESKRSLDELADICAGIVERGRAGPRRPARGTAGHPGGPGRRGGGRPASGAALDTVGVTVDVDPRRAELHALLTERAFRFGDFVLASGRGAITSSTPSR